LDGLAALVTASALFVWTHFMMSHPLRAKMVARLGEKGFSAVYSLVSFATLGWMIWEFLNAPIGERWWLPTDGVWIAASLLTLLASVFLIGSFAGNPALPHPGAAALAEREPTGMFRVTRHPMMWGIALWALAHMLVAPRADSFIFNGAFVFLALAGAAGQDRKKAKNMGAAWQHWTSRTSFWPRLSGLAGIGIRTWLLGLLLWLAATWAHSLASLPAAGIYRWL
jgi:uncharacterized membrane protein